MADESTPKQRRGPGRPFPKGTSGNPAGRPKGSGLAGEVRKAIQARSAEIVEAMIQRAIDGDTSAARALLDRILPAYRTEAAPVTVPGMSTGTLTERAQAALEAAASGEVAPDTAAALVAAVGALVRVIEVDELLARVEALEAKK